MAPQARDQRTRETQAKLVATARRLYAERGVEAVSLREIARAAGQANVSAAQYHFGDRDSLLAALLGPHHREVDRARHAELDALEASGPPSPAGLAAALVRPPAEQLETDAGREYLRIVGEVIRQPKRYGDRLIGFGSSLARWRRLLVPQMPEDVGRLHRRLSAIQLSYGELANRAATRRRDHALFVSNLVDLAAGILGVPVSAETAALLEERRPRRRRTRAQEER